MSTLFHEETHLDTEEGGYWEHLDVCYKQINNKWWNNTTDDYKKAMIKNIHEILSELYGGNSKLSKKDNMKIFKQAKQWEQAFRKKLGKKLDEYEP